jgi:hypothetical protein
MTASPLRAALDAVIAEHGCSLKDLTVLAAKNDPFRIDTPARHRDGQWLAETAAELGLGSRRIHLRGLHYMVLGRTKPDGTRYENTDKNWEWLQGDCAKAARFLGYIPFAQEEWETKDGQKRRSVKVTADEVAPSLRLGQRQDQQNRAVASG